MLFFFSIFSCEGCKGFFKRTVRKDLTYTCREERACIIDKKQRNRCQYCRYQKCLEKGMKREAVQEERQRTKDRGENEVESSTGSNISLLGSMMMASGGGNAAIGASLGNAHSPVQGHDSFLQAIHEAEVLMEIKIKQENLIGINEAFNHQAMQLFRWARMIPNFGDLPLEDQCLLIKEGWNELHIAEFAHRSVDTENVLVLANGICISEQAAKNTGIAEIFQRVLTELVSKMREMQMDKTELGCLRAVVLFNPGKT